MCMVLWANDCHPEYKLVVAANRDEFYQRPTLPAAFWSDNPQLLAGKDMLHGGTWMGVTTTGRFSTLTNYRDPSNHNPQALSRGHLVQKYLEGSPGPVSYMEKLIDIKEEFNGFNLLAGNLDDLYYFSNLEKRVIKVEKGCHGLSNSLLDVPWPKVTRGIEALSTCINNHDIVLEDLFELMADRHQPPDYELPQTGVSLELERLLAPAFVVMQDYGTRSTTVILVDRSNYVQFWERSFVPLEPGTWTEVHYEFQVEVQNDH
ncbi:hypothetical protein ASZ90_017155 [hydrocarbon metagenome]|uniref:NRDE family protein n=1 Tax=hydrocarbon metagenome TaxID=938273 RepID=A0A0W8EAJ7_9ZZZZ